MNDFLEFALIDILFRDVSKEEAVKIRERLKKSGASAALLSSIDAYLVASKKLDPEEVWTSN